MPTLNVCVQIYVNKKSTKNLLKLQIFLLFSEALSMYYFVFSFFLFIPLKPDYMVYPFYNGKGDTS